VAGSYYGGAASVSPSAAPSALTAAAGVTRSNLLIYTQYKLPLWKSVSINAGPTAYGNVEERAIRDCADVSNPKHPQHVYHKALAQHLDNFRKGKKIMLEAGKLDDKTELHPYIDDLAAGGVRGEMWPFEARAIFYDRRCKKQGNLGSNVTDETFTMHLNTYALWRTGDPIGQKVFDAKNPTALDLMGTAAEKCTKYMENVSKNYYLPLVGLGGNGFDATRRCGRAMRSSATSTLRFALTA
jgi:hypothetical protein